MYLIGRISEVDIPVPNLIESTYPNPDPNRPALHNNLNLKSSSLDIPQLQPLPLTLPQTLGYPYFGNPPTEFILI